jgi:ribosome-binding factor A
VNESRRLRLEGELQRALADLIGREIKDPRVGSVTITAVNLLPDLSLARVYFVPFAGGHPPEEVRAGLTHAGGFLRGEAGRRLGLRHAPRLEFLFDEQLERAQRLTDLIDTAVRGDRSNASD